MPIGLRAALDDDLPGDEVHSLGAPLADGTLLVCAARRDDLMRLLAESPADAAPLSLCPESLPPFVAERAEPPNPAAFNLLVGEFEPRAVRGARRRSLTLALATVLLCAALASLGLFRRAERDRSLAAAMRHAQAAAVEAVLPGGSAAQLTNELATLRVTRPDARRAPDASLALAAVLAAWPRDAACRAQSIGVGPEGASIAVAIPGDPAPFLRALATPPGWTMDEPRLNTADAVTRLAIRLRRP
ncbi:MAG: hypothetical protein JNM80_10425 [Phycisphaerae bacterium]|nr:hypothetical protein [Phycisphaerae bacterium]